MFKITLLRPVLHNFVRPFALGVFQNPVPATFGDPRMQDKLYKTIELEMKSAEPAVLKSYETFIKMVADELRVEVGKNWSLKKPRKHRWDLLKSVHIYRKHIVQYEVRTHYTWIQLHKMTGSTADTFLEYIERMLPEGVALKVTKLSIEPIPSHISEDINVKDVQKVDSGERVESVESEETNKENLIENGQKDVQKMENGREELSVKSEETNKENLTGIGQKDET